MISILMIIFQPEDGDDEDEEGQDEAGGDDEPRQPLVVRPLVLQACPPAGGSGFGS